MNLVDIIILVLICFFAIKGLIRGFVNEVSSLVGLLAGGFLAYRFQPLLAIPIQTSLHLPAHLASFVAFIIILLCAGICAHILGNIVTAALRLILLGSLNRLGGLCLGIFEGLFLLCMIFSIASSGYMPVGLRNSIRASESAHVMAQTGDRLLALWRERGSQSK